MSARECVVLYSGGTDSTCAAALQAARGDRLHLLTFTELGTRGAPSPVENVRKLREKFAADKFVHRRLSVDGLVRRLSYDRYPRYLLRHGFFVLSTPGFSSLSWHARTIAYCLEHGIPAACDGVTRELAHFPGHIPAVLERIRRLYLEFGIEYTNPLRDWDVPPDPRFVERLIVDRHGFVPLPEGRRTPGLHLYELGLMPHPNVKGSALDQSMQHSCYPFVLFNIFAFWYYLAFHSQSEYEARMALLFQEKIDDLRPLLKDYRDRGHASRLGSWLAEEASAFEGAPA